MSRKSPESNPSLPGKLLQRGFVSQLSSEDAFGVLFDLLPEVYFFVKDTQGRFVRMNNTLLCALGLKEESDILGRTDADFFSPFLAGGYREEDRRIIAQNRPVVDKVWFVPNAKGILNCYLCSKVPLHDRQGKVIGIAGAMRDARCAGAVIGPYEDLKPSVDHLNSHFTESIAMTDLADMVHLSVSQFQRRFRTLFQMAPVQYLIQLRIENACRQLHRSHDSISAIALQNGFYDQSAFCRQFQKRMGLTPSQYRARCAKNAELTKNKCAMPTGKVGSSD